MFVKSFESGFTCVRSVLSVWYKNLCGMLFSDKGEKVQYGFCTLTCSCGWHLTYNRFVNLDMFDSLDRIKTKAGIITVTSLDIEGEIIVFICC